MSIDLSFSTCLCSCGISTLRASIMSWIYWGANERKECILNGPHALVMKWWPALCYRMHHRLTKLHVFFFDVTENTWDPCSLHISSRKYTINSDPHTVHWIIQIYSTCSCHLWTACSWFLALRTSSNFSLFSDINYFFDICPLTLFAPIYIYL